MALTCPKCGSTNREQLRDLTQRTTNADNKTVEKAFYQCTDCKTSFENDTILEG